MFPPCDFTVDETGKTSPCSLSCVMDTVMWECSDGFHPPTLCLWVIQFILQDAVLYSILFFLIISDYVRPYVCHGAFQHRDLIWTSEQKHQCAFLTSPGGSTISPLFCGKYITKRNFYCCLKLAIILHVFWFPAWASHKRKRLFNPALVVFLTKKNQWEWHCWSCMKGTECLSVLHIFILELLYCALMQLNK